MKRWHLTLVLSLLAAAGVALAALVVRQAPEEPAPVVHVAQPLEADEPAPVLPIQTRPAEAPVSTIPELAEPLPPLVQLPPDPVLPDPSHTDPCPACGMG